MQFGVPAFTAGVARKAHEVMFMTVIRRRASIALRERAHSSRADTARGVFASRRDGAVELWRGILTGSDQKDPLGAGTPQEIPPAGFPTIPSPFARPFLAFVYRL